MDLAISSSFRSSDPSAPPLAGGYGVFLDEYPAVVLQSVAHIHCCEGK